MTDIRRFFKCGCEPDNKHFCKEADKRVWIERDAAMERVEERGARLSPRARERSAYQEGMARGWLLEHYRLQETLRLYEDVDFDAPENQPPDDGYDEAPKVVGYSQ